MSFRSTLLCAATLSACLSPAFADEGEPPAEKPATPTDSALHKKHSVNVHPWGFSGPTDYAVNYMYLLGDSHGLIGELLFDMGSDDTSSYLYYGGSVGYRWMWSGHQSSGFLGLNARIATGTGENTVDGEKYELSITRFALLPNIGKRWAWDNGFNITFRFGLGYASTSVSTNRKEQLAKDAAQGLEDILNFLPVGLDTELSVGWIF